MVRVDVRIIDGVEGKIAEIDATVADIDGLSSKFILCCEGIAVRILSRDERAVFIISIGKDLASLVIGDFGDVAAWIIEKCYLRVTVAQRHFACCTIS